MGNYLYYGIGWGWRTRRWNLRTEQRPRDAYTDSSGEEDDGDDGSDQDDHITPEEAQYLLNGVKGVDLWLELNSDQKETRWKRAQRVSREDRSEPEENEEDSMN